MNSRERTLTLLTGGAIAIAVLNTGFTRYRSALVKVKNQVVNLEDKISNQKDKQFDGAVADEQLNHLRAKSLPSDDAKAIGQYNTWLTTLVQKSQLTNVSIDPQMSLTTTIPVMKDKRLTSLPLYKKHVFKVAGNGTQQQIARLLDGFYHRDLLHRIRQIVLRPVPQSKAGFLSLSMDIEAVALVDAPKDVPLPGEDPSDDAPPSAAAMVFLNRNPMSSPNRAPRFAGEARQQTFLGKPFEYVAKFDDPEGHPLTVELAGPIPEGLKLEGNRITWQPSAKGDFDVVLTARDNGWPQAKSEQKVTIQVTDPPPPATEPPEFDESRTAVLTGLVRSGEVWQAWISLRTKGQTLRLGIGDVVKIGFIDGKIAEITDTQATIELADRKVVIRPGQSLAEAKPAT